MAWTGDGFVTPESGATVAPSRPRTQRNRYGRPSFCSERAVAAHSIVYLGNVG
jgi:hypothetical protein